MHPTASAILAMAALAATAGVTSAGDLAVVPPLEIDWGAGTPIGGDAEGRGTSLELLVGIHWASLAWRPTSFDLGAGYVGSFRGAEDDPAGSMAGSRLAGSPAAPDRLTFHGGYLTVATALESRRHWRTWIALRGEALAGQLGEESFRAIGAAVRLATELYYVAGRSRGHGGAIVGTTALGVYVEASYRGLPRERDAATLTAGLSVRLPLFIGR